EAETETVEHAWAIIREQHVARAGEPMDQADAARLFQIDGDAAFSAIHSGEVKGHFLVLRLGAADQPAGEPSTQIAGLAIFNLDYAGAHIGEDECCKWALDFLSDLDHLDSVKRLAHRCTTLVVRPAHRCAAQVPDDGFSRRPHAISSEFGFGYLRACDESS